MSRTDRLFRILEALHGGAVLRAQDLAARLAVSERTIYRDMDTLAASGVPVEGARGSGYRLAERIALPPLNLSPGEFEALNLGVAIVSEAADPDLKAAARALGAKLDAALPETGPSPAEAWKFAVYPFADAARGFSHMATLRAATKTRQKLRLTWRSADGTRHTGVLRPLRLDHWSRVWALTGWNESTGGFAVLRVDTIEEVTALPELFVDEPGKTLRDYRDA